MPEKAIGTNTLPTIRDWVVSLVPTPSTGTDPLMDGTAAVGTSTDYAREDHVHPSDTSKVDTEAGKGLSSNDFTDTYKDKLDGIEAGAEVNVNADWDAVSGDAEILNKPSIPTNTSDLVNDSGYITGTYISVNGDDYPIVYRGYTELSGVTGLLIHYDDGTLEGGNVFLPDGDAMNDVAQNIIAQIPTQYAGSPTAGGIANLSP